jgi:DNA sulfur modification protein DndD
MIIEEIILKNVGIYTGSVSMDLRPVSPDKPVILIGGLNGRGKTTLSNAILICLHGKNARCKLDESQGYLQMLESLINKRKKEDENSSIEVTYSRQLAGKTQRITVLREWEKVNGKIIENLKVSPEINSDSIPLDSALANNWQEHIESYFPAAISGLFFFDAEQIISLTDPKETAKLIESAMKSLLGLDLVEQLEKDLQRFQIKLAQTSADPQITEKIQRIENAAKSSGAEVQQKKEQIEVLQNKIKDAEILKKEISEKFTAAGGLNFDKLETYKEQERILDEKYRVLNSEIEVFSSGLAPLSLIKNLLEKVSKQCEDEMDIRFSEKMLLSEEKRDKKILDKAEKTFTDEAKLSALGEILLKTRTKLSVDSKLVLDARPTFGPELNIFLKDSVNELPLVAQRLYTESNKIIHERNSLRTTLTSIPDSGSISILKESLTKAENILESLLNNEKVELKVLSTLENIASKYTNELNDTLRDLSIDRREMAIEARIKEKSDHAMKVIKDFQTVTIAENLEKLGELITESFLFLLGKRELITKITISKEDYKLELEGPDGPEKHSRLSKGELQLLAVSVLWSLAKASGRPLPIVIDTPLARLDSVHRTKLVERYFPTASHQVMILSTDEEITPKYLEILEPSISRKYALTFDDLSQSTKATAGYFESK